jgi:hypothetical protein
MYAYKASQDVLYNPNYNLWTRIQHYTTSSRSAGSQYEMNQTRIFRLAKIYLQESNQDIAEALEPLMTDRTNQSWNDDEMSLILRAEQDLLTEDEESQLQATLDQSFDTTHPDFCKELALANLRRSFTHSVDLCKECLHVKHQEELDQNNGICTDCATAPPPIFNPEETSDKEPDQPTSNPEIPLEEPEPNDLLPESRPPTPVVETNSSTPVTTPEPDITLSSLLQLQQQVAYQSQLIAQLQQKVETLENFNQQLMQLWRDDNQYANQRAAQFAAFTESQNF